MNYLSRYEITCPDCGARFVPHKFEGLNFRCPCCGLLLERDNGNLPYVLALASWLAQYWPELSRLGGDCVGYCS